MALVLGTNCGFVTVAPTDDPEGSDTRYVSGNARALKIIAPTGATKITEIGWWHNSNPYNANFEVGLYSHNSEDDEPEERLWVDNTNAKGTTEEWKRVTGLDIPITAGTTYWLALQVDTATTSSSTDYKADVGERYAYLSSQSSLPNPWGTSTSFVAGLLAFYAVVEIAPVGTNIKITDSVSLSDSFSIIKEANIGPTETLNLLDTSYIGADVTLNLSNVDTTSLLDSLSINFLLNHSEIDTTSLLDSLSINFLLNHSEIDTTSLLDSVSLTKITQFSKTETTTLSDTLYLDALQTLGVSQTENLTLTDTFSIVATKIYSIFKTEPITLIDTHSISRTAKPLKNMMPFKGEYAKTKIGRMTAPTKTLINAGVI